MQFIDAYSFDVRSVKKTCVHIVHPDGRLIPFDTYNLFYRDGLEQSRLAPLRRRAEPWQSRSGGSCEARPHRRSDRLLIASVSGVNDALARHEPEAAQAGDAHQQAIASRVSKIGVNRVVRIERDGRHHANALLEDVMPGRHHRHDPGGAESPS